VLAVNMMTNSMIKESFKSGLLLFSANLVLAGTKLIPILLLTSIILPGFLFGLLLTGQVEIKTSRANRGKFILLAGGLYIFTSWISTGLRNDNPSYLILFATTLGAVGLFFQYKVLLDKKVDMQLGLMFSVLTGIASSALPLVGIYYDAEIKNDWLKWTLLFSVYLTWQPLFAWTLQKSKPTAKTGK
jgi:hypothetical protein